MNSDLISIIVPAYNIEKFVERCLESISAQTYQDLEIIVVDDGSTDSTAEVIDLYRKKDDRVITIHKQNGGVSTARSAGLAIATGEYIGFVDGDDYIEPQMFERLLTNMRKYGADISHCGYKMVFPDGHEDLYYGTGKLVEQTHEEGIRDLLRGDFVEPGLWNKLYRRSVVEGYNESSLWDESIRINEDLLLNYICFKKSTKAVYEDFIMYHYILRRGSAATTETKLYKLTDPKKVLEKILEDVKENSEIYTIVAERYVRILLAIAAQKAWKTESNNACQLLRRSYKEFRKLENYSKKIKWMGWLGGYSLPFYRIMRKFYDKVTGVGDKYRID